MIKRCFILLWLLAGSAWAQDADYEMTGSSYALPVIVWNDGKNTYFRFRPELDIPTILVAKEGRIQVLSFRRLPGNVAAVDGLDVDYRLVGQFGNATILYTGDGPISKRGRLSIRNGPATATTVRPLVAPDPAPPRIERPVGIMPGRFSVLFDENEVELSAEARQQISGMVMHALTASRWGVIIVRGRSDAVESPDSARLRARAVRDYLSAAGWSQRRLRVLYTSRGLYVADNQTADGRARNRRVELEWLQ